MKAKVEKSNKSAFNAEYEFMIEKCDHTVTCGEWKLKKKTCWKNMKCTINRLADQWIQTYEMKFK